MIRELRIDDLKRLREIHSKYFSEEFDFPNFFQGFLNAFVILDDNEDIIVAGGVKLIPESIIITNKEKEIKPKLEALYSALELSEYVCRKHNYDQLHAFIQDEKWLSQLLRHGFKPTVGKSIVKNI